MTEGYLHTELTSKIIGAFLDVHKVLGFGFLEKVYHNALLFELQSRGLEVKSQCPINVYYADHIVGKYYADLIVDNKVIVELKAVDILIEEHELQLINYLKATNIEIGLLLNFGYKAEVKRKIYTNDRKSLSI